MVQREAAYMQGCLLGFGEGECIAARDVLLERVLDLEEPALDDVALEDWVELLPGGLRVAKVPLLDDNLCLLVAGGGGIALDGEAYHGGGGRGEGGGEPEGEGRWRLT